MRFYSVSTGEEVGPAVVTGAVRVRSLAVVRLWAENEDRALVTCSSDGMLKVSF